MEWTLYKPATSRPCNPEHYFIGKGFIRLSEESIDILYRWCNILENKDDLESLLISDYSEEFTKIIEEIRRESALSQITYLKRVFDIIEQNNDNLIQRYLKYNLESSYEWCKRFNIPILISSTVFPLIEESQNVQQDSVQ
jgi:hypothetical protein